MTNGWPEKIRKLKAIYGLTQQDIAEALGTWAATVGTWERGERVPHKWFRNWIDKELKRAGAEEKTG